MILLTISIFALLAWSYLLMFRGGYWRACERLSPMPDPAVWPAVTAIIPARDEAASIGETIRSHMASDYPGSYSVILVDDHSSDGAAALAQAAAASARRSITIRQAPQLALGWTGKLNAVNAGVNHAAAIIPPPDYYLLTDADIVYAPSTLRRLVATAEAGDLALTSLMARLDARGIWGGLLVPAFVYFFQKLYPFPLVNDPANKAAAAAGGCMLVRRSAIDAVGGIGAIKGALIDDCALADKIKRTSPNSKIWLGLATDEVISIRDNRSLASIWTMVARTAFTQLSHSWILLAGTVMGMTLVYLVPAVIVLTFPWHQSGAAATIAGGAWIVMAATYFPTMKVYNQEGWKAALLPLAAALYAAMTISSAYRHFRGRGGGWKGRHY